MWKFITSILFVFDPESTHRFIFTLIKFLNNYFPAFLRFISKTNRNINKQVVNFSRVNFFGNIGMAAGFDKNADILTALPNLGFDFAEIGTVTPLPQAGNPKPRLFRLVDQESLFNQMGFNNLGAEKISARLKVAHNSLPKNFTVGVNVGKNKETPLEYAHLDYQKATSYFKDLVDYVVINVSSPNTKGLRDLQGIDSLKLIMSSVNSELKSWEKIPILLLKISPESSVKVEQLSAIDELSGNFTFQGWVLANTVKHTYKNKVGGLSGEAIKTDSEEILKTVRRISKKPIISVGGISQHSDIVSRSRNGADLFQVYTSYVYQGPRLLSKLKTPHSK